MKKYRLNIFILILGLFFALASCTGSSWNPEADLWGKWTYVSSQAGEDFYKQNLEFLEDGQLLVGGNGDQELAVMTYVIIASGRIKITMGQQSDILNYVLSDETLELSFNQGHNRYQRKGDLGSIAANALEPSITNTTPDDGPTPEPTGLASSPSLSPTPTMIAPRDTPTITPTPKPTLGLGSRCLNETDQADMVYIPAGTFLMGSDASTAGRDERPAREVYLDGFWIYQFPVINQQFETFVNQTGYQTTAENVGKSWIFENGSRQVPGAYWLSPEGAGSHLGGRDDHPVGHISYDDAVAYCAWADGRLPTEAEWEKVARGETGRTYPWGESSVSGETVNFCDRGCPMSWANRAQDDGYARTSPVGSFPQGASIYGAQDMIGNVWEWVADWYDSGYYATATDQNPAGPDSGEYRVIRGGSWVTSLQYLRAAYRNWSDPDDTSNDHGFRCVVSVDS